MLPHPATANPPASPTNKTDAPPPVTAVNGPNGSPSPGGSRLPQARRLSKGGKALVGGLAALTLLAIAGGAWYFFFRIGGARADLLLHKVRYEQLQLTIVERGALESADNRDIVCRVKAGTKNSTVASTIKWVIDDGSIVEAGDKLVELDDSGLDDQRKTKKIDVDKAESDVISARENCKIVESQNTSDIATAEVNLILAEINLQQYLEGEYQQTKKDYLGQIRSAQSDLEMWEERASWSERMSRPDRRYVTAAQAESDRARKMNAELQLSKVREQMRVLEDPKYGTKLQKVTDLQGKIDEAKRALDRVKKQAVAKLATAEADRKAKESVYQQQLSQYQDIEQEIKKCVITAPEAGLVVYYVPEQARFGSGSQQSVVAQGEPVREGQKLMRIPDLNKMLVNTKVHEAMVSRVKGEKWEKTGFSDSVQASLLADVGPLTRLLAQAAFLDQRSKFVEDNKKYEMLQVEGGQHAVVRVEAFPDRLLKAHVKTVATVASQQDWLSADVKVYQTMIAIDEEVPGLKPGMSAAVTVFTDAHRDHVLAVPLQALFGTPDMGQKRLIFVMTPQGPRTREVTVGLSNDTMAEIQQGLQEGDEVVLNPRVLLSEKERAQYGVQAGGNGNGKGHGMGGGEGKGEKGKGGKDKGKGGFKGGPDGAGGPGGGWPKGGPGGPGGAWPKGGAGSGGPAGPGGGK
jgi:multidrug resistance efflux pump